MAEEKANKPSVAPKWIPKGWFLLDTETGRVVVDWRGTAIGVWEMAPGFSIDTRPIPVIPTLRRMPGVVAVNSPPPRMSPAHGISIKELCESGRILPENEEEGRGREKWEKEIRELVESCFDKPQTLPDSQPPKS